MMPQCSTHDVICAKKILIDSGHHKFVMTESARKRCCWHCTFDLIGLLPTNHIIAYITMAYRRFLRKSLMLTAKTMQNI